MTDMASITSTKGKEWWIDRIAMNGNRRYPDRILVGQFGKERAYYPERTCEFVYFDDGEGVNVRCSACGRWLDTVADVEDVAQFNHCPLCGARIKEGEA